MRVVVVTSLALVTIIALAFGTILAPLAALAGIGVALASWFGVAWSARALLSTTTSGKAFMALVALFKYSLLGGLLYLIIVVWRLDPMLFALGFTVTLVGMIVDTWGRIKHGKVSGSGADVP